MREGRAAAAAARNATGGEERCALLDLRFASAADLAAMGGDGARLGAAAAAGAVDEVEALVAAGAAVDARDWDGRTALGAAAAAGHAAVARALLERARPSPPPTSTA